MSVVRNPSGSFSRADSNDRAAHSNLVCLSDSDRVSDEPARGKDPRATSSLFVFETNLRGELAGRRSPGPAFEHVPAPEDTWSGLDVEQTLGQLMTAARTHLGLSREQVADETNIPAYYVRMIESDTYDAIPDQLYLLPFFERYAIFLGLDAQKVVSRFICDFEKAENEVAAAPAPKSTSADILSRWRQIAAAAVAAGILLPCVAWGIGKMRAADRPRAVSVSITPTRQLFPIPGATVSPPSAAITAPAAEANAGAQLAQKPRVHAMQQRRGHARRLSRRSKHWKKRTA